MLYTVFIILEVESDKFLFLVIIVGFNVSDVYFELIR